VAEPYSVIVPPDAAATLIVSDMVTVITLLGSVSPRLVPLSLIFYQKKLTVSTE